MVELLTGKLTLRPDPDSTPATTPPGAPIARIASDTTEPTDGNTNAEAERVANAQPPTAQPGGLPAPVAAAKPLVHVVVPLTTLTGADDGPVELTGYGPLPPTLGRKIAADAVWKRLISDRPPEPYSTSAAPATARPPPWPSTCAPATGTAGFPSAADAPSTRRSTTPSPSTPAAARPTATTCYHACLCHHRMKDAPGWSVTQHSDGKITWTTPTGHRYTSTPTDYRPEPDLAAVVAALEQAATATAAGGSPLADRPRGSPLDRPAPPEELDHPVPF